MKSPRLDWPSKEARERWEIDAFMDHYRRLSGTRVLEIVRKGERPDWVLRDCSTGELVGVRGGTADSRGLCPRGRADDYHALSPGSAAMD